LAWLAGRSTADIASAYRVAPKCAAVKVIRSGKHDGLSVPS
jgi:hypothetical protein